MQEVLKMSQLESFPVITIKTIIAEGNTVVIESTGIGRKKGNHTIRLTVMFTILKMAKSKNSLLISTQH